MTKFNALIASTSLAALMVAVPAIASQSNQRPAGIMDQMVGSTLVEKTETSRGTIPTSEAVDDEYGLMDVQVGTAVSQYGGSMGEDVIPVENQLESDKGIIDNQNEAMTSGTVTTADNASIGTIERVMPTGQGFDTVYIAVSDTLDSPVSKFKINVPVGSANDGQVQLAWTLSELLNSLEAQI